MVYPLPLPTSPKCDDETVEFRGGATFFPPNSMLLAFGGTEGGRVLAKPQNPVELGKKRGSLANSFEDQSKGEKPVNPQKQFCPNLDCHARGHVDKGNISAHSHKEKRFNWIK